MLPEAKNYLVEGGLSAQAAAYTLIGCFLAGVIGIQIISRFLHHYIPSHVVDCDHTHEEHGSEEAADQPNDQNHQDATIDEDTPLLSRDPSLRTDKGPSSGSATIETSLRGDAPPLTGLSRRPSLQTRLTMGVTTLVSGGKASCDQSGPCYGYSDPCGQECFKAVNRSPTWARRFSMSKASRQATLLRSVTTPSTQSMQAHLQGLDEEVHRPSPNPTTTSARGRSHHHDMRSSSSTANGDLESGKGKRGVSSASAAAPPHDPAQAHHHHVPTNAFLSIGLQTSIAIALHKLPEGFITFATNHANPEIGFAVFLALFIHNITEGFAMALPLYLALGSRLKAMLWSSLLGGISQPLGAGVAAIWFKMAGRGNMAPGERAYGGMFAVTAGIMASVALQLFTESLSLTHNRNLCVAFAFLGMGILGLSFALTAE
ncbi:hypothetical protein MMC16_004018 [Acarospora aff. strigata]|nr:hypothetical protein [Acarospora aff. strigata]